MVNDLFTYLTNVNLFCFLEIIHEIIHAIHFSIHHYDMLSRNL